MLALPTFGIREYVLPICATAALECYSDPNLQRFEREVRAWSGLNHPNILPFLGFVELPKAGLPTSLVSPWMKNGNALVFCNNNPHNKRMPIVRQASRLARISC